MTIIQNSALEQKPIVHERGTGIFRARRIIKRAMDIVLSALALVVLAVPMAFISLAIVIDSKGDPIFRQDRVGQYGESFEILKFRTMYITAPGNVPKAQLKDPERHITRVGRFLRKTSLDELPQLVNVFRGDMSLVGSRPLVFSEKDIHRLREEAGVYRFRPGLTGWAQINGRDLISEAEKVRLDSEYIRNFTIANDIAIMFRTIPVVLNKEGYVEGKSKRN